MEKSRLSTSSYRKVWEAGKFPIVTEAYRDPLVWPMPRQITLASNILLQRHLVRSVK
jgi:hypothetical protein